VKKKLFYLYLVVFVIWAVTIVAKIKYNGLVFGLDYGLYHPDGTLYTMRALDWAGYTERESASIVSTWYNFHAFKFNNTNQIDFLYNVHPKWSEYYPRVLYPFLSIPFVKFFGVPGMLVVPALSLLVVLAMIMYIGIKEKQLFVSLILVVLVSGSSTVTRWMMSNTTDSLFVAIFTLSIYFLYNINGKMSWFLGITILIAASGLTRMSLTFWLAIGIVLYLQKHFFKSLFIGLIAFLVFIPTLLSNSNNSFLPVEGDKNIFERTLLLPQYFLKVSYFEFGQLFVLDRVLFAIILGGVYTALWERKRIYNQVYLLLLLSGLVTGALNGTVGVNFRYQLPVLVFACWSLIANLNRLPKNLLNNS